MKLLFILGMQKSGTSLLNRMLMQQSQINNPFLPEGKFFWGDNPPFTPVDEPCGKLYQSHTGKKGHSLDESDFNIDDQNLLIRRIEAANVSEPILMNKNPYNSVRIKWLKSIFPNCKIVVIYRNPIANVYSLLKKYDNSNNQKVGPEDGWWGIKPKNWQSLLSDNKVSQCSHQWLSVNNQILQDIDDVDLLLSYSRLCLSPNDIINKVISLCNIDSNVSNIPKCKNFNKEYLVGSRLLSKNTELRKTNSFEINNLKETIEFPPLSSNEVNEINHITQNKLKQLNKTEKKFF